MTYTITEQPTVTTRLQIDTDLPPLCPQCGCHRVHVVGQSDKGALKYLRCADCNATAVQLAR